MRWMDVLVGDVVFAWSGPWVITEIKNINPIGMMCIAYFDLVTGEFGADFWRIPHELVSTPILRDVNVINPDTQNDPLW